VAVIEGEGFFWSDCGSPARIADTLLRMGKRPAFPMHLAVPGRLQAVGE